jgi:fatty acid synthase
LSSLLHLINPYSQYFVLQTPTALVIKDQHLIALIIFLSGIRDLKTVSLNSTLAELGMDSMTAVEIKETLEREVEIYLTPQEILNLTFARLNELSAANECTEVEKQRLKGTYTILF